LQRKQQYLEAAKDLEVQLKSQRELTAQLRQKLTDLEAEVQKAYTKKQGLIARDKAAQATSKANEILSKTTESGALSVIEKMETKVKEREAKAQALAELSGDTLEKQFRNFEGKSDIEQELLLLKGSLGKETSKLVVDKQANNKEPVLLEAKGEQESDLVDAE